MTRRERRQRILILMRRRKSEKYPNGWTWNRLATAMNKRLNVPLRAFRNEVGGDKLVTEPSLETLRCAARALNCTVGFLVDLEKKKDGG